MLPIVHMGGIGVARGLWVGRMGGSP